MSEQAVTKAFLRRFRDTMLAGQFKDEAEITGGTISNVIINDATLNNVNGITFDTPIDGASGGTGVANTGKTITLGGNLTTSGAFALTLTLGNTTNVTLPSSGVLATRAGSEAFTNKTYNGLTITSTTGTLTLPNGSALILSGANSLTFTTSGPTNITLPTSGTMITNTVTTLSSLTSIGTIGTGIWQGTIIDPQYGGTGVNNVGKTITLGNNFTTSGNFALTLTQTGTTNVTLPTTGTLATRAGTETFTNKTLTSPTISGGSITGITDLVVADGGTGVSSLTAYAPIFGGTTATGAVQSGTVGTAGQVLTSNGAGALPTFQNSTALTMAQSAEIAVATGDQRYTFTHGLGGTPKFMQAILRCKTADLNYAVGDEVVLYGDSDPASGTGTYSSFYNATICGLNQNVALFITDNNASVGAAVITYANWRLVFRAWI